MKIPNTSRRKALIIVDVQSAFLDKRTDHVVANIIKLINGVPYDLYIEAVFNAEKGSVWDIQQNWICPKDADTKTVDALSENLRKLNPIRVEKETKSVFKGNKDVNAILKENGITEVHVVGLDTSDCVLATAYESFDFGFITYVIEECCQSSASDQDHKEAVNLLREQNMTNNSSLETEDFITVD